MFPVRHFPDGYFARRYFPSVVGPPATADVTIRVHGDHAVIQVTADYGVIAVRADPEEIDL